MAESEEEGGKPYSQAFETFVQSDEEEDDVIGLLAYALYKQSVREEALAGNVTPADRRAPPETTVQAYRGAASQLLTGVIDRAIEDSTPAIQESAVRDAVHASEESIKAHVSTKTSWKAALVTNLAAWLISLAIVFLVLVLARAPEVTDLLVGDAPPPRALVQEKQSAPEQPVEPLRLPPPTNRQ